MNEDLKVKIGVNTTGLNTGLAKATSYVQTFANKVKLSGSDVTGVWSRITSSTAKMTIAIGALTGAVGALGLAKSFLSAARETENYRLRLEILLRSQSEGSRLFQEMADYAGRVPFAFNEIMAAATQLSGVMKGGVDEIRTWMPMIGDLAAVSGLGIQETTSQIVRMYSAGAAAADAFRERGITSMLGFTAGVKYSAEETRAQLMKAWQKQDSQFRGATEKMAQTWDGLMSMMGDKWFQFRNLIMEAGIFNELKTQLSTINDEAERWVKANESLIKTKVPEYIEKIKIALQKIWDIISYDTAILQYGIVGLAIHGRKGAILLGSMAHMATWASTLGKALGMASAGILDYKDVATANFKELQELVKKGERMMDGPFFRGVIKRPSITSGKPVPPLIPSATKQEITTPLYDVERFERIKNMLKVEAQTKMEMHQAMIDDWVNLEALITDYEKDEATKRKDIQTKAVEAQRELLESQAANTKAIYDDLATRMTNSMGEAFIEMIMGTKSVAASFTDMANSIIRDLLRIVIQRNITEPLAQGLSPLLQAGAKAIGGYFPGGGSGGGYALESGFHAGGRVPQDAKKIPRLHGGLKSDEFAAVLQRGESVIPRGGGPSVTINIINQTGTEAKAEQSGQPRWDGEKFVTDIILTKLANSQSFRQAIRGA